jgi:hypothetical protein
MTMEGADLGTLDLAPEYGEYECISELNYRYSSLASKIRFKRSKFNLWADNGFGGGVHSIFK